MAVLLTYFHIVEPSFLKLSQLSGIIGLKIVLELFVALV